MCFFAHRKNTMFTVVTSSNTSCPGCEKVVQDDIYPCLWSVYLYVCVCTYTGLRESAYGPLFVCVSLLCTHQMGVEVSPSGLFNRHQLSFLLQEMNAADYYPRIHKFFMGKLKL